VLLQWSARSDPAASTACARSAKVPDRAFMLRSSLISSPSNPISPRMMSCVTRRDVLAGASASMDVNTTCAVMAAGMSASALNGAKSVAESVACGSVTTGSSRWLSAVARPCPGMCLITGKTPPAMKPCATARASAITCCGSRP
jgi:hypothetical protein